MNREMGIHMETHVGFYTESDQPNTLFVHLGEILAHRSIEDCQEARAAMYGVLCYACEAQGLELVLVRENDVPCMRDIVNELSS